MILKRTLILIISIMLVVTAVFPAFACAEQEKTNGNDATFKDVPNGHWAYDAIKWMTGRKIAEGTGNGMFSPDKAVARDEFAKMMVLTLKLELINPDTSSFKDIKRGSGQSKYVETAKQYLTGFRSADGDYFHPSEPAVREDMAVALVKALGFGNETIDESVLASFSDAEKISPNLKKYVAAAVKHSLMKGYSEAGGMVFAPQESLTRSQAAVLLYKAFKANEEKVTFNEEKISYDNTTPPAANDEYTVPKVRAEVVNGRIVVRWDKINSSKFTGYKVVISKNNPAPAYPDDGYFDYITDRGRTYSYIQSGNSYNGGDFDGKLESGTEYYFSITVLYGDKKVAGNAVKLQMP